MAEGLPARLLAFYGDDFTGSTDAMESLALEGLRTILFLEPPTPERLERFDGLRCCGVAGISRSLTPAEMEAELRPVLAGLQDFGAPLVHYKVCSTFDSSPQFGSIGQVLDLGRELFGTGTIPLLVGAPVLRRYTVFGNHFATVDGETYRLDRHPVMAQHPITPMNEADLRRHLARQTDARIGLMDILALDGTPEQVRRRFAGLLAENPDAVLFDVLDPERLNRAGGLIWELSREGPIFVVGSSGVGYALTGWWREAGLLAGAGPRIREPGPVSPLLVVSGSASPVTRDQIRWSGEHGFSLLRAPAEELVDPRTRTEAREALFAEALGHLEAGRDLVIFTALGPADESIEATRRRLNAGQGQEAEVGQRLGEQLGLLARRLVEAAGLSRLVVAGGDTAGAVTRRLDIYALEMELPVAPGSPICRAYAEGAPFDGLRIALKGGQVGRPDYFARVKEGRAVQD